MPRFWTLDKNSQKLFSNTNESTVKGKSNANLNRDSKEKTIRRPSAIMNRSMTSASPLVPFTVKKTNHRMISKSVPSVKSVPFSSNKQLAASTARRKIGFQTPASKKKLPSFQKQEEIPKDISIDFPEDFSSNRELVFKSSMKMKRTPPPSKPDNFLSLNTHESRKDLSVCKQISSTALHDVDEGSNLPETAKYEQFNRFQLSDNFDALSDIPEEVENFHVSVSASIRTGNVLSSSMSSNALAQPLSSHAIASADSISRNEDFSLLAFSASERKTENHMYSVGSGTSISESMAELENQSEQCDSQNGTFSFLNTPHLEKFGNNSRNSNINLMSPSRDQDNIYESFVSYENEMDLSHHSDNIDSDRNIDSKDSTYASAFNTPPSVKSSSLRPISSCEPVNLIDGTQSSAISLKGIEHIVTESDEEKEKLLWNTVKEAEKNCKIDDLEIQRREFELLALRNEVQLSLLKEKTLKEKSELGKAKKMIPITVLKLSALLKFYFEEYEISKQNLSECQQHSVRTIIDLKQKLQSSYDAYTELNESKLALETLYATTLNSHKDQCYKLEAELDKKVEQITCTLTLENGKALTRRNNVISQLSLHASEAVQTARSLASMMNTLLISFEAEIATVRESLEERRKSNLSERQRQHKNVKDIGKSAVLSTLKIADGIINNSTQSAVDKTIIEKVKNKENPEGNKRKGSDLETKKSKAIVIKVGKTNRRKRTELLKEKSENDSSFFDKKNCNSQSEPCEKTLPILAKIKNSKTQNSQSMIFMNSKEPATETNHERHSGDDSLIEMDHTNIESGGTNLNASKDSNLPILTNELSLNKTENHESISNLYLNKSGHNISICEVDQGDLKCLNLRNLNDADLDHASTVHAFESICSGEKWTNKSVAENESDESFDMDSLSRCFAVPNCKKSSVPENPLNRKGRPQIIPNPDNITEILEDNIEVGFVDIAQNIEQDTVGNSNIDTNFEKFSGTAFESDNNILEQESVPIKTVIKEKMITRSSIKRKLAATDNLYPLPKKALKKSAQLESKVLDIGIEEKCKSDKLASVAAGVKRSTAGIKKVSLLGTLLGPKGGFKIPKLKTNVLPK